tara:strand:- start:1874 stop:2245 length:372 start_codon:yes stop_codon:yes gene_type:complete
MSGYTDGFVAIVAKNKIKDYQKSAAIANEVWLECGALDYKECIGEDLESNDSCGSFLTALKVGADEAVIFSWISFESREHRDAVNAMVIQDPRIASMCGSDEMPFDPKRMLYGGFEVFLPKPA